MYKNLLKILLTTFLISLLLSCSENGRYIPFTTAPYTYKDDMGYDIHYGGEIYYMDTQTGKYYKAELGSKNVKK